jgi:hypothetical protein
MMDDVFNLPLFAAITCFLVALAIQIRIKQLSKYKGTKDEKWSIEHTAFGLYMRNMCLFIAVIAGAMGIYLHLFV